jgi:hypothetical protein
MHLWMFGEEFLNLLAIDVTDSAEPGVLVLEIAQRALTP